MEEKKLNTSGQLDDEMALDFAWLRVRHLIKNHFKKEQLPDLNAILFIIGIQELGRWQEEFSKEEKQDLMHIATCRLLSYDGYYDFVGRDADGWPHYEVVSSLQFGNLKEQEILLKKNIVRYFRDLELENGGIEQN